MNLLLTSDLHFNKRWYQWLEGQAANYDLISIAGDLLDAFSRIPIDQQIPICIERLKRLSASTNIVICSGNHDPIDLPRPWLAAPVQSTDWLADLEIPNLIPDSQTTVIKSDLIVTTLPFLCPVQNKIKLIHRAEQLKEVHGSTWLVVAHDTSDLNLLRPGQILPDYWHSGHIHQVNRCSQPYHSCLLLNSGQTSDTDIPDHIVLDTKTRRRIWHRRSEQTIL
jgi:predicted phosphodiesterase